MSNKHYCVLAIQKIKTMGGLQRRYEHNLRIEDVPNAEFNEEEPNEELVNHSGMDYHDLWYRRIREVELQTGKSVAIRKNTSVLAYEIVTTFSREADVDVEAWKKANVQWMQDTFGAENVLSMQFHADEEGCEHIHSIVIPIDDRGHLCAKSFTGGRAKMFALHNSYAKAMEPLGLSRGEMFSRAKKQDLRRFYGSVNDAAKATVPEMEPGEMIDDYVDRVNQYLQMKELAHLKEKTQAQRDLDMARTQTAQLCAHYAEAMNLQDLLMESYEDEEAVKKRLQYYQTIELAVPRKVLATLLDNLLQKFPPLQNIRTRKQKNRKHIIVSTDSDRNI